jgi:hypothetical protein
LEFGDATAAVWILTVADDLMVEALRPVKDGIATVADWIVISNKKDSSMSKSSCHDESCNILVMGI